MNVVVLVIRPGQRVARAEMRGAGIDQIKVRVGLETGGGRQAGRAIWTEELGQATAAVGGIGLLTREAAGPRRGQIAGGAGDIGAGIDQVLCQAVPAAVLLAIIFLIGRAEFRAQTGGQVRIKGRREQGVLGCDIAVIAVGILNLA